MVSTHVFPKTALNLSLTNCETVSCESQKSFPQHNTYLLKRKWWKVFLYSSLIALPIASWIPASLFEVYYSLNNPSICFSAHIFTANHIMHLPTAMLSTDQPNGSPGFLSFQLTTTITSLWRWLLHRLLKRQSQTTVLLKTPITQMIFFNHGMLEVVASKSPWSTIFSSVMLQFLLSVFFFFVPEDKFKTLTLPSLFWSFVLLMSGWPWCPLWTPWVAQWEIIDWAWATEYPMFVLTATADTPELTEDVNCCWSFTLITGVF